MQEKTDRSFLGKGWSFPPTFRKRWHSVEMLEGEADIRSAMKIILDTITGERILLPTFGCNLQPYIFEQMTPINIAMIRNVVFEALVYHEPRIIVGEIEYTVFQEQGLLELNIPFTIIRTNTRTNYVYPFYMAEATDIKKDE
jgi:uncharacterized protein